MTAEQADALRTAVIERKNILVAGGTSTGKTTLTNALLAEVATTLDRVVLIEDTRELQCAAKNLVSLRTKDGVCSLSDLVRSSLRLRPDRIPIGEVRGPEALDLLKAWGTGHPGGIGTIHAGSALGALRRLEQLIQEAVVTVSRSLIAETIDVVAVPVRPRRRTPPCGARDHARPHGHRRLRHRPAHSPARRLLMTPRHLAGPVTLAVILAVASATPVQAAGSNMPWEAPLQAILESIEGPVAKIVAVMIIIITGLTLAFGDSSGGARRLIQIVFGLSIAFAASSFFLSFFSFGGGVVILMAGDPEVPGFFTPVHRALTEPMLLAGAPRTIAIANGTLAAAIGLGLRLWLVGLALWLIGHLCAVWAAKRDAQFVDVVRRHLRYPAHLRV